MRSIYLTLVFLAFFVLGAQSPFVLTLGYVWVDIFRPNTVAYSLLNGLPVSMIMGAGAVGSYLLLDRRDPPSFNLAILLTLCLAIWVTLTTFWAVAPEDAWSKWNWAFKTVAFSAFVPFAIRSQTQIEAFIATYAFSFAANILPAGAKTLVSGGGYGRSLGLVAGNTGISEGSTMAAVSVSLIPIFLFLKDHGTIIPRTRIIRMGYWGLIVACIATAVGTYERTGLAGLAIVAIAIWLRSRRKLLLAVLGAGIIGMAASLVSSSWEARMSTIDNYGSEGSALGRILAWKWTWNFVQDHPFGGGFNAYVIDTIVMPEGPHGEPGAIIHGKAFHSILFEVLGEHGYPGLAIYLGLAITSIVYLLGARRASKRMPELQWCADLSSYVLISLITLLFCGAFIGIAFQPPLYYFFSASVCVHEYIRRSTKLTAPTWETDGDMLVGNMTAAPDDGVTEVADHRSPPLEHRRR